MLQVRKLRHRQTTGPRSCIEQEMGHLNPGKEQNSWG